MYKDSSIKEYSDDLAAKKPAPGGGSASALAASLGTALISMVVNFTIGKPKYAAYQKQLETIIQKAEDLRKEFLNLVDLDCLAYKSKDTRDALNVPFMVCRLCFEAMKLCPPLIKQGNLKLLSDVAVAAVLLESGFSAAYFNVKINLKILADKKMTQRITAELDKKEKAMRKIRQETEAEVDKIIRG